jgi:hypothetical protein
MTEEKRGFDLNLFAKPFAQLETRQGTIYAYWLSEELQKMHRELAAVALEERARRTLARTTSQVVRESERA